MLLQNELRYGFDVVTDLSCLRCASTPHARAHTHTHKHTHTHTQTHTQTHTNFSTVLFNFIIALTCVQCLGRSAEPCVCVCVCLVLSNSAKFSLRARCVKFSVQNEE